MSELISGKEAWIAKSEHKEVDWMLNGLGWQELTDSEFMGWDTSRFLGQTKYKFRLKPRTITINGIEVPCNKSKHDKDDVVWVISTASENWYDWIYGSDCDSNTLYWETEEEIKQVVAALRSVFNIIKL